MAKPHTTIREHIRASATAYRSEFADQKLDQKWSETAYKDLSAIQQMKISMTTFHDAVQQKLNQTMGRLVRPLRKEHQAT